MRYGDNWPSRHAVHLIIFSWWKGWYGLIQKLKRMWLWMKTVANNTKCYLQTKSVVCHYWDCSGMQFDCIFRMVSCTLVWRKGLIKGMTTWLLLGLHLPSWPGKTKVVTVLGKDRRVMDIFNSLRQASIERCYSTIWNVLLGILNDFCSTKIWTR